MICLGEQHVCVINFSPWRHNSAPKFCFLRHWFSWKTNSRSFCWFYSRIFTGAQDKVDWQVRFGITVVHMDPLEVSVGINDLLVVWIVNHE